MKIYVDIDNTICRTHGNDYRNSTPIKENIDKVNKLYDEGHTITYWTARGCKSGKTAEYFGLTYNALTDWGAKFHELRMAKPHYDLFIDDKNLNALFHWDDESIAKILQFQHENDSKRQD